MEKKKARKQLLLIYQRVEESLRRSQIHYPQEKMLGRFCKSHTKEPTKVKLCLQTLKPELRNFENIGWRIYFEYLNRMQITTNQMKRNEETVDKVKTIKKILGTLGANFDYAVSAIQESTVSHT